MKYLIAFKLLLTMALLGGTLSGCVIEPVKNDVQQNDIKGAPDWVNRGSTFDYAKDEQIFYGVSSISLQGDMALQKSIAEDRARAEVGRELSSYLEVISDEYANLGRSRENMAHEEMTARQHEEATTKQIKEAIARQIDDAIARQFKETVSRQFKEEVARQIKDASAREIREAISNQTEFALQIEEILGKQIKSAVARQLVGTTKTHLSGVKISGSWRDPRANTIWSLAELNMKQVKVSMADIGELNNELKKFFEQNAEMIFDKLIAERNTGYRSGWSLFQPSNR